MGFLVFVYLWYVLGFPLLVWPVVCETTPSTVIYLLVTQQMKTTNERFISTSNGCTQWLLTILFWALRLKKKHSILSQFYPHPKYVKYGSSKSHSTSCKSVTNCRKNEIIKKKVCKSVKFYFFIHLPINVLECIYCIYLSNIYRFCCNILSHSARVWLLVPLSVYVLDVKTTNHWCDKKTVNMWFANE